MKNSTQITDKEISEKSEDTSMISKTPRKKFLLIVLLVIGIVFLGLIFWLVSRNNSTNEVSKTTSYLTNNNGVLCIIETAESHSLKCEDLNSKEVKEYKIPEEYQNSTIIPSPDGTKLLIVNESKDNSAVITDINFKEISKVSKGSEFKDNYPSFIWADTSNKVLISVLAREQGDADFLPEPLVVKQFNVETGETRRVYKTGTVSDVRDNIGYVSEGTPLEDIKIIGSDGTYLFISYQSPKNWVADDVNPPQPTINAIRLSDGFVLPVTVNQASTGNIYYNQVNNSFLSFDRNNADSENSKVAVLLLEKNSEFGLVLRKKSELTMLPIESVNMPIPTSMGVVISNNELPSPVTLQKDDGTITELQIKNNTYSQILSIRTLPNF